MERTETRVKRGEKKNGTAREDGSSIPVLNTPFLINLHLSIETCVDSFRFPRQLFFIFTPALFPPFLLLFFLSPLLQLISPSRSPFKFTSSYFTTFIPFSVISFHLFHSRCSSCIPHTSLPSSFSLLPVFPFSRLLPFIRAFLSTAFLSLPPSYPLPPPRPRVLFFPSSIAAVCWPQHY